MSKPPGIVPPALRLALMAERVLPPGAVERTICDWPGLSIICQCGAPLVVIGPMANPLGVQCSVCGALDAEAQQYSGPPTDWRPPKIEGELYYNPSTGKLEEWPWIG